MKIPVGTVVQVVKLTDDTADPKFLRQFGIVMGHNTNGLTGNTEEDPMHRVNFKDGIDQFWYEELKTYRKARITKLKLYRFGKVLTKGTEVYIREEQTTGGIVYTAAKHYEDTIWLGVSAKDFEYLDKLPALPEHIEPKPDQKVGVSYRVRIVGQDSWFSPDGYSQYNIRYKMWYTNQLPLGELVYGLEQAREHIAEMKSRNKGDEYDAYYQKQKYEIVRVTTIEEIVT